MRLLAPGVKLDNTHNLQLPKSFVLPIYCCRMRYDPGSSSLKHTHPYYEIFTVSQGSCICNFRDKEYVLNQYDLCVVRPGDVHSVHVPGNVMCEHYIMHADLSSSPEFDSVFNQSNIRRISDCADLLSEQIAINDNAGTAQLGTAHIVHSLFTIWLVKLARRLGHSGMVHKATHEHSLDVEMAQEYIDQNANFRLSPKEVALAVGVSQSSLSHRFAQEMSMSVFQYIRLVLMQIAVRMLEERNHTISEIAAVLGFPSIHYFSRYFKKYWNVSPRAYQKQIYTKPQSAPSNISGESVANPLNLAYYEFPIRSMQANTNTKSGLDTEK